MFEQIQNFLQRSWPSSSPAVAPQTEAGQPRDRTHNPQEDMSGSKRARDERGALTAQMRPPYTAQEQETQRRATFQKEHSYATRSSGQTALGPYSATVTRPLHTLEEEANALAKAGAPNDGASAPPQLGASSSRPPYTAQEQEYPRRATIQKEHSYATRSSGQTTLGPYSAAVTGSLHTLEEEGNAPAKAGAPNDGASAPPHLGAGSSSLPNSPAVRSLRNMNNPLHGVQSAQKTTSHRHAHNTSHDYQQRPLQAPPVARSRSSQVAERANQSIEREIKQLEEELALAHDELDGFRVENERLVNKCKGLEAASKIEMSHVQELRIALHAARTDVESRDQRLDRRDAQIHALQQEIERLKASARNPRALEAKVQETESALALSRRDLEIANNQLNAVSDQKTQLSSLLKDRTFELKGAQSFLTTADTSSGADVISMLQRLNSEILQSAAYMAESMVDAFPFQLDRLRDEDACEVVRRSLGSLLAHYLATKKHKNDPLLIQIAFQTSFVQILKYVIGSWSLSSDDANNIYTNTYERIRTGEVQAVSGRWRALAIAYAPSHDESTLIAQITPHLAGRFANIMLAAGCSAPLDVIAASAENKLSDRIALLFNLATKLKKIVMEEITSADLTTIAISGGVVYSAEEMEDAYIDGDPATGGVRVLCTTDLGLKRITRLATSGGGQWDIKMLIKPKVALETVVNSMDE